MKKKSFVLLTVSAVILIFIIFILFFFRGFIFSKLLASSLIQAGKPMKFGAYTVFIERIENNKLFGITVSGENRKMQAQSGEYVYLPQENVIRFNLIDGMAQDTDPKHPDLFRRLTFKQMLLKIKLGTLLPEIKP